MRDIAMGKLEKTRSKLPSIADQQRYSIQLISAELEASKIKELGLVHDSLTSEGFQIVKKDEAIYVINGSYEFNILASWKLPT